MNLIILKGRLGHGATVRVVGDKRTPVVNFSLAVAVGYGANQATEWRDCAWWGEAAEKCVQWLTRGREVLVQGAPSVRLYQKRDGAWAAVIDVRVDRLEFCGKGDEVAAADAERSQSEVIAAGKVGEVMTVMNKHPAQGEDVPF